jgi:hypothetical protein
VSKVIEKPETRTNPLTKKEAERLARKHADNSSAIEGIKVSEDAQRRYQEFKAARNRKDNGS